MFCRASFSIPNTSLFKRTIIFNDQMPSAYITNDFIIDNKLKKHMYSVEHIFPRSFLRKRDHNDMHNIIRTFNDLNVNRSNYKYTDILTDDKHWIELDYNNYVNHKLRLFIPNTLTRGFIARAILYMIKEYDYDPSKVIINKDVLVKWFHKYPPNISEKYHNDIVYKLQKKNNIFISSYHKKSIQRFIDSL